MITDLINKIILEGNIAAELELSTIFSCIRKRNVPFKEETIED